MSIDAVFTQFFADIHDQRQSEKIHYAFYDVLFLTVCAVIGGADGWEEIEDFGEIHLPWFQSKGLFKNGIPVHDTIARIISRIKPAQFQAAFISWISWLTQLMSKRQKMGVPVLPVLLRPTCLSRGLDLPPYLSESQGTPLSSLGGNTAPMHQQDRAH